MSWIAAIFLLGILVFVHEMGHLLAGLSVGMKAEAFSIGFGPTIVKKEIKGILFKISIIPFGGYCKFKGESPDDKSGGKDNFLLLAPLKRIWVYFAGPLFNFIFAIILLTILVSMPFAKSIYSPVIGVFTDGRYLQFKPGTTVAYEYGLKSGDTMKSVNGVAIKSDSDFYNYIQDLSTLSKTENLDIVVLRNGNDVTVSIPSSEMLKGISGEKSLGLYFGEGLKIKRVADNSSASEASLEVNDEIIAINDVAVNNIAEFRPIIMDSASQKIVLTILRDGTTMTREAIPSPTTIGDNTFGSLGVEFLSEPMSVESIPGTPFPASIGVAFVRSGEYLKSYFDGLALLFTGKLSLRENLGGPVRILQLTSQVVGSDIEYRFRTILSFTATISLVLFFMNLLPLPVVDGGMIVISFIELIRGKPIKEKILVKIQTVGALFLITLAILITINDISQLFKF